MAFDIEAFGRDIVSEINDYVDEIVHAAVAPLLERIAVLENRKLEKGEKGDPGERGIGFKQAFIDSEGKLTLTSTDGNVTTLACVVGADGAPGDPGKDGAPGRDVDMDAVNSRVEEAVAKAVSALPVPKDGAPGAPGKDGAPGRDVDMDAVNSRVEEAVAKAVSALPVPKDGTPGAPGQDGAPGRDVDMDAVNSRVEEAVAKAVSALPVPKDGVNLAGMLINNQGELVATLSNGSTQNLGRVLGKDGEPGRDGVSPEEFVAELKDERTLVIRFVRNGVTVTESELNLPIIVDRGIWREGEYKKGDGVTWAGSFFIAQKDTDGKPGESPDWRLAVKRGRDGKPGTPGEPGKQGPKGGQGPRGFGA